MPEMVEIPGKNIEMLTTEVTQDFYEYVMGINPSRFKQKPKEQTTNETETEEIIDEKLPVDSVSWYDAVYFCNKLSIMNGLTPVYSMNGTTDVKKWKYKPNETSSNEDYSEKEIKQNLKANGYRLPTKEEWEYAAKGGEKYKYPGSDTASEVAWYYDFMNSDYKNETHFVGLLKPNGYGLYDMYGTVAEWCTDGYQARFWWVNHRMGGTYSDASYELYLDEPEFPGIQSNDNGFRIVRNIK